MDSLQKPQYDFVTGETLLINKPYKWTSFDVVNKIRSTLKHKLKIKKIKVGHAGTLDPLATGLLIVCTGKSTKKIDQIQAEKKSYTGSFILGKTTPSFDLETEIVDSGDISKLSEEDVISATQKFIGEIEQTPPLYSAIKIDGKRAYEYARSNKEVFVKSRNVIIHDFKIINIELPKIDFAVECSKGTYLRSLARDFGEHLNCGAYLSELCRTQIGEHKLSNAWSIEDICQIITNMEDHQEPLIK